MAKKTVFDKAAKQRTTTKKTNTAKKALDTPKDAHVESASNVAAAQAATQNESTDGTTPAATSPAAPEQTHTMITISLTRNDKKRKSNAVAYIAEGYAGSVRFSKSFFADKTGPASLTLSAEEFANARQARAKMTPEERKAARAAQPKLTPEQKLAKIEERAAKLRAKIANASA